jgi:hypothetical protein
LRRQRESASEEKEVARYSELEGRKEGKGGKNDENEGSSFYDHIFQLLTLHHQRQQGCERLKAESA